MLQQNTIKRIFNLEYYTALHLELKSHYKNGQRPTEFGNKVWGTSIVLINHFKENPLSLQNQRVLEIGCGQGVLGIFLAKNHSCDVTCSDFDQKVLPIVDMHAKLNNVKIKTKQLAFNEISENYLENFDVIIGAEVCYCEEVGKDIINLTNRAFKAGVKKIMIGDPGRPDFEDFQDSCNNYYNIHVTKLPSSANGKVTTLLTINE